MEWREIRKNEVIFDYIPLIWEIEQGLPRWFRESAKGWRDTQDDLREFAESCDEIYGLFDGEKLMLCVYFELQSKAEDRMIHLSVLHKVKPSDFIVKCSELRDQMFRKGVRHIRGWIVQKNFGLCRLLAGVGFTETGLLMDKGDRPMRWCLIEVFRA